MEIGLIMAVSMALTPILTSWMHWPQKLRGLFTVALVVVLNIVNVYAFGNGDWLGAGKDGLIAGLMAIGIYSAGKNTYQHAMNQSNKP